MKNNLDNVLKMQKEISNKRLKPVIPLLVFAFVMIVAAVVLCVRTTEPGDTDGMGLLVGMFVVLIGILVMVFGSFLGKQRKIHSSLRNLPTEVQERINEDCMKGQRYLNAIFCRDCLLVVNACATAITYKDIVWIYGRTTTFTSGLVPMANMSAILIYDKKKTVYEVNPKIGISFGTSPVKSIDAKEFMETIQKIAPWVYLGYTDKMSFEQISKMVAQRVEEIK